MINNFRYGAEQPQTCLASINEQSPFLKIVLRSKTMKQVIDIAAITCTIMYPEAILKLGILQTNYMHI